MSKLSRLLTMAALVAAASQPGMTDLPRTERQLPKFKGESPRCKTCIHYKTQRRCLEPMRMACENYSRKKKKR